MALTRSLQTEIRRLHHRRGREQHQLSLAEGIRLVEEALAAEIAMQAVVVTSELEATHRGRRLAESLVTHEVRVEQATESEFKGLAATDNPQGVLAIVETRVWSLSDLPVSESVVLVLDAVQDPGNVGTMVRTAWSLGACGVLALPGTVEVTNPKVLRASMGATFRLPVISATIEAMSAWLEEHDFSVWVSASAGDPIGGVVGGVTLPSELALVVGNEGAGVRAEIAAIASRHVGVPLRAGAESLNVSVAAGILLHEVLRDD